MQSLSPADWLLVALGLGPAAVAIRFGSQFDRASAAIAFQVALAASLLITGLGAPSESLLSAPLYLAILLPALLWASVRQDCGARSVWLLPALSVLLTSVLASRLPDFAAEAVLGHAMFAALLTAHAADQRRGRAFRVGFRWHQAAAAALPPVLGLASSQIPLLPAWELPTWAYLPAAVLLARTLNRQAAAMARAVGDSAPLIFLDDTGGVSDANPSAFALFGITNSSASALEAELVGAPALRRLLEDPTAECAEFFRGATASDRRCFEARVVRLGIAEGTGRTLSIHDVTTHREAEQKLFHQAHFDSLTGLPNRRFLQKHLRTTLSEAARSEQVVAVIYFDLDRFKAINDSFGHAAGDELLRIVAHRLRQTLQASRSTESSRASLSRLGGDEFVVVVPNVGNADEAARTANQMLTVLSETVQIEGRSIWNSGSAGIALFPDHGDNPEALLRSADAALYHAKETFRGGYCVFHHELTESTQRKARIEQELRRAIGTSELELFFQPKYRLDDGSLAGAEALLRWKNAELGSVTPKEFIPVAEEFGLIHALGAWVIESACAHMARWRSQGLTPVPVSINVSTLQLAQGDLAIRVASALREHSIEPSLLEIELTESSILEEGNNATDTLLELQSYGVRISLDDFGTGYSSLSYLNRVPLDVLKLDRNFLRDVHLDPSAGGVVSAVISMAHSLGLEVVAEGVDCEAKSEILAKLGCDLVQGFSPGPPMCEREFAELLRLEPGDLPSCDRVLAVDDGSGDIGLLAMRINRMGIVATFASAADEALLLLGGEGDPVRALLTSSKIDHGELTRLIERIVENTGQAPALVFVGEGDPPKELIEARPDGRVWSVQPPLDDALLRHVVRTAISMPTQPVVKRTGMRAPVELPATLHLGDREESTLLSSLSVGGAFVETDAMPSIFAACRLEFMLEDVSICVEARVLYHAWNNADTGATGFGVQFTEVPSDAADVLREYVSARAARCL